MLDQKSYRARFFDIFCSEHPYPFLFFHFKVPAELLAEAFEILIADNMRPANAIFGILAFKSREEGRQLLWNMIKL